MSEERSPRRKGHYKLSNATSESQLTSQFPETRSQLNYFASEQNMEFLASEGVNTMAHSNSDSASEVQSAIQAKPITPPTTLPGSSDISLVRVSGRTDYPIPSGTPSSESFLGWGVLMTFLVVATAFLRSAK